MEDRYKGQAIGIFEMDNLVACYVALDAASKAADVMIQGVERNRLKCGACVKMRGDISNINAAMEVALKAAAPLGKLVHSTVIAAPTEGTDLAMEMTIKK
ncbi:MAG: BMC domain-containing protein [Lachnospiraceae bacterium]|nr:BMC domain-containing protein [Lachnospiraceae bacterium]